MAAIDAQLVTKQFGNTLKGCLTSEESSESAFQLLKAAFENAEKADNDTKKLLMDQGFRDCLTNGYLNGGRQRLELDKCRLLVELSISAARSEFCSVSLPISIMADIFDVLYLDDALSFFSIVEDNVVVWKEPVFFGAIKNNLLRICNDLLRRLSRTQDTVFCGRILLFLAKFFPFSERSGLNIISEFNIDNVTLYTSASDEVKSEATNDNSNQMDVDNNVNIEKDTQDLNIDYALYSKFWKLQDYFRNPVQCYDKMKWVPFAKFSKEVLDTFKSFKIDSVAIEDRKSKKAKTEDEMTNGSGGGETSEKDDYFAKYLTNQNLLQLQLSDANFRRYILVQFLILFQYLKSTVKFKTDSQVLSDEQSKWVENSTKLVYDLIEETPPNGKGFGDSVRHMLEREEQWNRWKNEGCPSLKSKAPQLDKSSEEGQEDGGSKDLKNKPVVNKGSIRKRKRRLGDQIKEARASNKYLMGNANLTKLWNFCPNNLDAAAAPERDFLPSIEEWMADAAEQLDPAQQVEEAYRKVNDGKWGWKALRLLAKKSNHFYTYGLNKPIGTVPEYLTERLKEHYPNWNSASKANSAAATAGKDVGDKTSAADNLCTNIDLKRIAENLDGNWEKLIPKLGQTEEDIASYQKEESNDKKRGLLMLQKWKKDEGEAATKEEIEYILEGLKLQSALEGVFSPA